MTPLIEWARRHQVSPSALSDLQCNVLGTKIPTVTGTPSISERGVQQKVRIKASSQGRRMWRNNVGVAFRDDGVPIRFGLANDSTRLHQVVRSSDLIGITPLIVEPRHVGTKLGIFTSWEIKRPGWKFNPNDHHQVCQANWNNLVLSLGGDGRFITSETEI